MDSFGDVAGVTTVMVMIWLGAVVARWAWREHVASLPARPAPAPEPPPGDVWLPLLSD